jgi:hypothetical protein
MRHFRWRHGCLAAIFIALVFASCATEPRMDMSAVRQLSELQGRPLTAAFARLGSHTVYDRISRASELAGEFYTPINARFPLRDPGSRSVFIREVRWQRGDRYVAVFATRERGAWVVFEAIEWGKDLAF